MSKKKKILLIAAGVLSVFVLLSAGHIIYMRYRGDILKGVEFSASYADRNGELLQVFLTEDDQYRIYKPLSEYPQSFIEVLLQQEDKYFYKHMGINPVAMIKAGWETYVKKSRRMGASTITMQVAKLKYNLYTKNITGKLKQICKALYLEMCFSKDEILDAYVNLVPCGGNIEGFQTAAWYYFNKDIKTLNLSENIMLCVLPQNPVKRAPTESHTPSEMIEARKKLFATWVTIHPEDADKEIYMDMQLSLRCKFPDKARHFTEMLAIQNGIVSKSTIKTSIDLSLQDKCENLFNTYINQNRHYGVNNGAVLLIDTKTMEVTVNIGSADYYDDSIEGQVNATTSKRSPGSTLKPFIYAMALEQGLIHYSTMLKDTPITFNEYSPDNYGSVFKGPVQAWFALADSRNIPAIALENKLEGRNLYDFMKACGVTQMKDRDHYGLSIVLGTCEVTMLELLKMYGILANKGYMKDINFLKTERTSQGEKILSEESCFIVKKMLEANVPPYQQKPKNIEEVPVAYKTGTSIGFKDSWSVGIFDRYIAAVWIGNFDGHGNNAFLGRTMAAPLLFNIAYSILADMPKEERQLMESAPPGVKKVEVCSVSGALPSESCSHTEYSWFIPGVSPITKCKIHRKINIDTRTGYRTDETDAPYVKTVVREFWPSDLQNLFEQAGLPRLVPPDYPPEDFNIDLQNRGFPPEIISPSSGIDYVFRNNDTSKNVILLYASCDADTKEIIWFADSEFLGRTKPGESLEWKPVSGQYLITASDSKGRSDWVEVSVQNTFY